MLCGINSLLTVPKFLNTMESEIIGRDKARLFSLHNTTPV